MKVARRRVAVVLILVVAVSAMASSGAHGRSGSARAKVAIACGASARQGEPAIFDYWCGRWQVDFGAAESGPFGTGSGHITFTRISQAEGQAVAEQDFGVFPFHAYDCDRERLFYRARFDWGGGGDMILCTTQNGLGLVGRYRLDNLQDSSCCGIVQSGDVSFSGGGFPRHFGLGTYTVDDSGTGSFHWTGSYLGGGVADPKRFSVTFHFTEHGHPDHKPSVSTQTGGAGTVVLERNPAPGVLTKGRPSTKTQFFHLEHDRGSRQWSITLRPNVAAYGVLRPYQVSLRFSTTVVKSSAPHCPRGAIVQVSLVDGNYENPDEVSLEGEHRCALRESFTPPIGSGVTPVMPDPHRLSVSIGTPSPA